MFKTAATKLAHNSTIPVLSGNSDLKPLQDLIIAEKAVLTSLQRLSVDFQKSSEALRTWGLGEGDDLGTILDASTTILLHFSSALSHYATHENAIREHLKSIRTKEELLDDLKKRRRSVYSKAESAERKLAKMSPESKNITMQTETLNRLREEMRNMDFDIMTGEAALGDLKRSATRTWMGLKFGGLLECCEKGMITGEMGKLIISEIPEEVTQPGQPRNLFYGHPKIEGLVAEAHRCIGEVAFSTVLSAPREQRRQSQPLPNVPLQEDEQYEGQGESNQSGQYTLPGRSSLEPPYEAFNDHNGQGNFAPPIGLNNDSLNPSVTSQTSHLALNTGYLPSSEGLRGNSPHFSPINAHNGDVIHQSLSSQDPRNAEKLKADEFGVHGLTKNQTAATFPLRGKDDPPSLKARHMSGPSLSLSIAEALGIEFKSDLPPGAKLTKERVAGDPSIEEIGSPAPAYDATPLSVNPDSLAKSQKGRKQPPSPIRESPVAIDSAVLAYMTEPASDDEGSQADPHDVKHVRSGQDVDISTTANRDREPALMQEPVKDRHSQDFQLQNPQQQDPQPEHQVQPLGDQDVQKGPHSIQDPRHSPHRVPAPTYVNPEEEERQLNLAAAREVSRELDMLHFQPPARPNDMTMSKRSSEDTTPERERQHIYDDRPPQLHLQQQRVPSPHPLPKAQQIQNPVGPLYPYNEMNGPPYNISQQYTTSPQPYNGGQSYPNSYQSQQTYTRAPAGLSPAQAYAQMYKPDFYSNNQNSYPEGHGNPLPPRFQGLAQSQLPMNGSESQTPPKNPLPPRFQNQMSMSSHPNDTQLPPLPPRFQSQNARPLTPEQQFHSHPQQQQQQQQDGRYGASTPPYRTAPEHPPSLRSGSFEGTRPYIKSSPSLHSLSLATPPALTTRTISASAFKRPTPPPPHMGYGSNLGNISGVNENSLMGGTRNDSRHVGFDMDRNGTSGYHRRESVAGDGDDLDDYYTYDEQSPPPVRKDSPGRGYDDARGYGGGRGYVSDARGGYGEGRFATNLEHGSR